MNLRSLWQGCFLWHASDPLIVMQGKQSRWECRRCQADLGPVLTKQKLKVRKSSAKVIRLARKRSA